MAQFIPEEHYKGVQSTTSDCPLAFITPYGTDKAAINRMETVDSWCGNYQKKNPGRTEVIKNVPMHGFKIAKEVRRWSTSNVVWRIEDPRGFQLEISSGNMAYLISETIVDKGVFMSELIWCRDGKDNFLLPVGSEEHKKYTLNTTALTAKLSLRDINIGDHIHDVTGTDGIYLGGYYQVVFEHYHYGAGDQDKFLRLKRAYFVKDVETGDISIKSNFKGLSLIKKGAPEDNKDYSDWLNNNECSRYFICVFKKKPNELEIAKTARYIEVKNYDRKNYYAQIADGGVYHVSGNTFNSNKHFYRMIIDNQSNTYERESIQSYGDSYHSMSTFGLHNPFNPGDKIDKLIRDDSRAVKLVVTINDKEFKVF